MTHMERTPDQIEALHQLRRFVSGGPDTFNQTDWTGCTFGLAAKDEWFKTHRHTRHDGITPYVVAPSMYVLGVRVKTEKYIGGACKLIHDVFGLSSAETIQMINGGTAVPKHYILRNIDRLLAGDMPMSYTRMAIMKLERRSNAKHRARTAAKGKIGERPFYVTPSGFVMSSIEDDDPLPATAHPPAWRVTPRPNPTAQPVPALLD